MRKYFRKKMNPEKHVFVITGAGLSAPSGISTFRDTDGLWEKHDIEVIASEHSWRQNHDLIHEFYNQRRSELQTVKPTAGHDLLTRLQQTYPNQVTLMTQNVDDLLERSGSTDVIHLHGELDKMECVACGNVWSIGYNAWNPQEQRCPKCNSRKGVKPYVVFFGGKALNYRYLFKAFQTTFNPNVMFVIIGTNGNVIDFNEHLRQSASTNILCNLNESELNEKLFTSVYKMSIIEAVHLIEKDVENFLKS